MSNATDLPTLSTLTPAQIVALHKALAAPAKKARDLVAPGDHNIGGEIELALTGTLRVGEDYEQRLPHKAKPWAIVAALLRAVELAGIVGVDVYSIAKMAMEMDPAASKEAEKAVQSAVAEIAGETVTPCRGKVTGRKLAVCSPDTATEGAA